MITFEHQGEHSMWVQCFSFAMQRSDNLTVEQCCAFSDKFIEESRARIPVLKPEFFGPRTGGH